jgi:hypothetical protein
MAEAGKSSGKYAAISEVRNPKPSDEPTTPATSPLLLPSRAKQEGKRSDPAWKQFAILLRKDNHKRASRILRDRYEGTDMSDLMDTLLDRWLQVEQVVTS